MTAADEDQSMVPEWGDDEFYFLEPDDAAPEELFPAFHGKKTVIVPRLQRMDEYIRILAGCVERVPKDMVIHRMTGDGAKRDLIAPEWSADKKRVLNAINRYFEENDIIQGRHFKNE